MLNFMKDFIKTFSDVILVICFMFASFLIFMNLYHMKDISYHYYTDIKSNSDYKNYINNLGMVDKKMHSVDLKKSGNNLTAAPIYNYYKACYTDLTNSTYSKFKDKEYFTSLDIYKANNEIKSDYYNSCLFAINYEINKIGKKHNYKNDYKFLSDKIDLNRKIVLDDSNFVIKSNLANSSYSFSTDIFKGTIYNKTANDLSVTVNNYLIISSVLNDIADWYVLEFGGK